MNAKPEIYLDIPLQQPAGLDDGSPQNRLRLERAEINKGGLGFQANIMEDERIVASAGLRAAEAVLLMVLLNHVSGQDLFLEVADLAPMYRTRLLCRLYLAKGGSGLAFAAWANGGALHMSYQWAPEGAVDKVIASARLDEAGLTGVIRLLRAMESESGA